MLSLRSKPELKDLSQGSRIAYVRYYRGMTQHQVADMLGVQHDNKRRITRNSYTKKAFRSR